MANQLRDVVSSDPVPHRDLEAFEERLNGQLLELEEYLFSDALTPIKKDIPMEEDVWRSNLFSLKSPDMLGETPLHFAARHGEFEYARKILLRNSGFARDLNQDGDSPLHLAAANGFVEIVREISKVGLDMCFLRDKDGRTALHRAVIKGRVEVVNELLRVCPESLDATTARGDTALHLALAYGQIKTFRVLVEWVERINKKELINWKDREGNTVLHVATSRKQLQALEILLDGKMISTEVEVNALNARGLTALDILYVLPQNLGERIDMEIVDILRRAGGLSARDTKCQPLHSPNQVVINYRTQSQKSPSFVSHKFHETENDSLSNVRNALLVVAVMIASVTFQALLVVPVMTASVTYQNITFQPRKPNLDSKAILRIGFYSNQSYQNITFQPRKPNLDSMPILRIVFYRNQSYQNFTFHLRKPNLDSKPIAWIVFYSNQSSQNITFQPRKPNLDSKTFLCMEFDTIQSYQNITFQPRKPNLDSKPIAITPPTSIRLFAVFNSAGFFASMAMIIVLISGFPLRPFLLIAALSLLVSYMCLIEVMLPTEVLFVLIIAIPFVSFAATQYIFHGRGWGSSKLLKLKWMNLGELTGLQMPS